MWKDNHSILSGGEKKQYNSMIPSYNEYIMKDFIFVRPKESIGIDRKEKSGNIYKN